jgi:type VI secretion system secreted protein VgrG
MPHGQGHAPFRPQMTTPRPVVAGSQTAIVVGPPGEEIFPDKYGRVKVHFHWDRISRFDPESSCWLRVSTGIAGKGWGTVFTPRVGQEVIVDFLEGDPDRPIITGCVYNPESMPPYELPKFKTMSTIKTMSTPNGSGFNELRFEDKKGSEQIFVHAEKNVDVRVKNDVMETIKNDRHLIVENDQLEKVKKDKHLSVGGDHNEKITGTMSLTVAGDLQEKVNGSYAIDVGSAIHQKANISTVIEAGTSLTLKVGGNFININAAGIFIKGTMVMLNSGGAAGSGAGSSPDAPKDPKEADNAQPGSRNEPGEPQPPHKPVIFSPMSLSLQEAAQNGTPFCEICAKLAQQRQQQ